MQWKVKVLVAQSCLTLYNLMDSPLGSYVHGISQARILGQVVIPFSRGSSWARNEKPWSPELQADSLPSEPPGKPHIAIQMHQINMMHPVYNSICQLFLNFFLRQYRLSSPSHWAQILASVTQSLGALSIKRTDNSSCFKDCCQRKEWANRSRHLEQLLGTKKVLDKYCVCVCVCSVGSDCLWPHGL